MGEQDSDGSAWRRWLGPTDAPPKWSSVLTAAAALLVGAAFGLMVHPERAAILSGLAAVLVAAAGASGPPAIAVRVSLLVAGLGFLATTLAFSATGHPVWAGLAMAAVTILASAAVAAGPIGAALGALTLLAYVLAVALSTMAALRPDVSIGAGILHIAIGCAAGVVVSAVSARLRRGEAPPPPKAPSPLRPIVASLRTLDAHARDGLRRAIPLGLGIFLFEANASRDALWIFVAAFVVLLPAGKPPVAVMAVRVTTTIAAVALLGVLATVVAHQALFGAAIMLVFVGLLYGDRYPLPAGVATTMGTILFAGAPSGAIGTWATHRLLDTALGCGLAIAATFLLWPRDAPDADPAPAR